ncbi:MAG TPA: response regulator [Candidatus Elarobacter sp.]
MAATPLVIVVEDDQDLRRAFERVLIASGFAVRSFGAAEAFLDVGRVNEAACLVVDIRLPGISGFDLVHQLRTRGGPPPTIFISAFDDAANRKRACDSGSVAYLAKPFLGSELVTAVKLALSNP